MRRQTKPHNTTGRRLTRHWQARLAILGGTLILAVILALLATTPAYYRHVSLQAHDLLGQGAAMRGPAMRGPAGAKADMPGFDLRTPSLAAGVGGVIRLLISPGPTRLRVDGLGPGRESVIGIETSGLRGPIRMTFVMWLAGATILIFLGLSVLRAIIRHHYSAPLAALIETLTEFSGDPAVATPIPAALTRSREFIAAAQALDTLQRNTLLALRQRERLADIGEAVAKINHDIRNVLSSATLVADTLLASQDPRVRRAAPHIIRSLEQSVTLVQSMMDYLAETPPAEPGIFSMRDLTAEIGTGGGLDIHYDGPETVCLDRLMMSRILLNLARNAADAGAESLSIDVWRAGKLGVIDIADDGLGIPREQWDDLFLAFRGKGRSGTGLGLAIARDLAVAQGGALKLTRSTPEGSEFRLQLPVEMFAT